MMTREQGSNQEPRDARESSDTNVCLPCQEEGIFATEFGC